MTTDEKINTLIDHLTGIESKTSGKDLENRKEVYEKGVRKRIGM